MSKIIIGLHGLGNKPPKAVLEKWWKSALSEGLKLIGHEGKRFNFELVYWADILHPEPLDPELKDPENPLYLEDPYKTSPGRIHEDEPAVKERFFDFIEKQMDKLLLNEDFSKITDVIVRHYFRDLDQYYSIHKKGDDSSGVFAKNIIRDRLNQVLSKYSGKKVMLIAHSMGSIIAYDVLARPIPEVRVETFITMGSPLGIPFIINRTKRELGLIQDQDIQLATPSAVNGHWFNFSDLEDKTATSYRLSDKYRQNGKGVKAEDFIVYNDYEHNGKRNPHKSYGYLRSTEVSNKVYSFLNSGLPKTYIWFSEKIDKIRVKIFQRRTIK